GTPVVIRTSAENSFKLTPRELEEAITPKTRAIILNTPSNPTGSAYGREELAKLGDILAKHGVAIISDEIYEKLVYGGFRHVSVAAACPAAKDVTITINGVSKAYAMTGWRMGYAAGPRDVISKMTTLLGQQITGIPGFVQRACVEAMTGPQEEIENMRKEFAARRDMMLERMLSIQDIACHVPEGAFYLLPNVEAYLGRDHGGRKIAGANELASYLLEEAHIATVSGDPFGIPGHIRFSYAASRQNIEEGTRRLKDALLKLK
ncbi:MAG TPA: aminotransferase class I/II-fold pyridoxal phosphate-dependent enzyme, partial [bacterium]|nr:aminotransferase class I/II-fold pyridoxal phosphate-dependent enzyme [bacterium]